jgi:hypothetical protein
MDLTRIPFEIMANGPWIIIALAFIWVIGKMGRGVARSLSKPLHKPKKTLVRY